MSEDLTQETFMKVVANEHQFKGKSSVRTWIFRIAYTTTMSYFRKNKPQTQYEDMMRLRWLKILSIIPLTLSIIQLVMLVGMGI